TQVDGGAVPRGQKRGTHGAWRFALRAVHHAVDQQGLLVAEELREVCRAGLGDKLEVFENFSTGRQSTTLRRNALDLAAQLDLIDKKSIAGRAIAGAFIGKMSCICSGKLLRGDESL